MLISPRFDLRVVFAAAQIPPAFLPAPTPSKGLLPVFAFSADKSDSGAASAFSRPDASAVQEPSLRTLTPYNRLYLRLYPRFSKYRSFHTLYRLIGRFFNDRIYESGASLAYFFLFSLLALLILMSSLVPMLPVLPAFSAENASLIPAEIEQLLTGYYAYLKNNSSLSMLLTGLFLTFLFVSRTARSLEVSVNRAMRLPPRKVARRSIFSFLMTGAMLLSILLSLVFSVVGDRLILVLCSLFPSLSSFALFWRLMRRLIPAALLFVFLLLLYTGAPNRKMTLREALPGSIVIFVLWILFSWLFSLYVTYAARYSLLYGSLCGVIVLLLWLYFFGVLLMVGAELNGILMTNGSWRERQRLRIKQTDPPAQSAEQADNPA